MFVVWKFYWIMLEAVKFHISRKGGDKPVTDSDDESRDSTQLNNTVVSLSCIR